MIGDFFRIAAGLKSIPRQGWADAGIPAPESVADHSYCTSIMAMVMGDALRLDTHKLVKMSLLHDLAESLTGDITPRQMPADEKRAKEQEAMKKILACLPIHLRQDYTGIWAEYTGGRTAESELLHEIDKLEMAMQAVSYSDHNIELSSFLDTAKKSVRSPELKKILDGLCGTASQGN